MRKVRLTEPCFKCGGSHYMKNGGSFEPHIMYNPQTGEGVEATTYEDHLALQDQGFVHEDEMQMKSGGNWIQDVTKSIERRGTEGRCTGANFGGPDCPKGSPQYNLAVTFRKMANTREKKQYGGKIAEQNESTNSMSENRKGMFIDHVSANAQNAIVEDAMIEQQQNMQDMYNKQMYDDGGNTWMKPDAYQNINAATDMYLGQRRDMRNAMKDFGDQWQDADFNTHTEMYFDPNKDLDRQSRKEVKNWYNDYTKNYNKALKQYDMYGPDAFPNFFGPDNIPDNTANVQEQKRYGGMPQYALAGETDPPYNFPRVYQDNTVRNNFAPAGFQPNVPTFDPLKQMEQQAKTRQAVSNLMNNPFINPMANVYGALNKENPYAASYRQTNNQQGSENTPDFGSAQTYTYPGKEAEYKKIGNQWYISNANTGFEFQAINDPDGKRGAELNKNAVVAGAGSGNNNASNAGQTTTVNAVRRAERATTGKTGSGTTEGKTTGTGVYTQDQNKVDEEDVTEGNVDASTLTGGNADTDKDGDKGADTDLDKDGTNYQNVPADYNAWMAGRRGFGRGTGAPVWMPLPSSGLMEGWDYTKERRGPLGLGGRRETWHYVGAPGTPGATSETPGVTNEGTYNSNINPDGSLRGGKLENSYEPSRREKRIEERNKEKYGDDPYADPFYNSPGDYDTPNKEQILQYNPGYIDPSENVAKYGGVPNHMYPYGGAYMVGPDAGYMPMYQQQPSMNEMQYGGVVELPQDQIDLILAMGGKVEYLD